MSNILFHKAGFIDFETAFGQNREMTNRNIQRKYTQNIGRNNRKYPLLYRKMYRKITLPDIFFGPILVGFPGNHSRGGEMVILGKFMVLFIDD